MSPTTRQKRRARVGVSLAFLILGTSAGLWFVHIPVFANRLELSPARLGLILLCLGLGSLIFQPVAGLLLQRVGTRTAAVGFQLAGFVMTAIAVSANSATVLAISLFCAGAAIGGNNVAINTQGAIVENVLTKPVMSSFHAFFSLGTFCAAGLGGALIAAGLGDGTGVIATFVVMTPLVFWAGYQFLDNDAARQDQSGEPEGAAASGVAKFLSLALITMMLLAFVSNAVEFSVNDWSALFLHEVKGMSLAWAVSGFAVFSLVMALMRFLGGSMVRRLGVRNSLSFGGLLIALGMGMVVFSPWPVGSVLGFAVVAIGLANNSPLLVSQASQLDGIPASIGVSVVATGLTAGFLLAPPIIGFIAELIGLAGAFAAMAGVGIVIFVIVRPMTWREGWEGS